MKQPTCVPFKSMIAFIMLFCSAICLAAAPVRAQEGRVDALLASMTLEQRVAQMFMVTLHGAVLTEQGRDFLTAYQPGAVVLFTSNVGTPSAVTTLTNAYQSTITAVGGAPLIIAIDQEGGVVSRLPQEQGYTFYPTPLLFTAAGPQFSQQAGVLIAGELAAVGINMNLAPVADLETNRQNPIITRRAFGNDPVITGEAVAAFVRGTQSVNVLATAKHFPGHGDTNDDSHATLPILNLSRERLHSVELEPFRAAIRSGAAAVMVSHIWFPQLDPTPNMPASLSPVLITDLLRGELGFDGIIMTDALDMNAVDLTYNFYDAVLMAVNAGVDLLAMGPGVGTDVSAAAIQTVIDAVRRGEISEARIDASARRILETKARFELLDWEPLDPSAADQRVNAEANTAWLETLFENATTLAYDRNDLIPIRPEARTTIIFLGTRYQIQAECAQYSERITWVGVSDAPSADEIGWAVAAARDADTVVVWTQNAITTPAQAALVGALPAEKTIAVAIWSPYDWQTYPNVAAYVATYSPARPAIPAACAILFGAAPARGQLPLTLRLDLPAGSRAD
ncbi:MAG: glycoside hydrolase family 3 protein [bacterium]|nr:glycoside hydrolase family 3 protein [bacterium]